MQDKWRRLLESLLESGKLNDWEQNVFKDIYDRNPPVLSKKQQSMFNKAAGKYLDGTEYEPEDDKTEYDNCSLEFISGEGCYVTTNDGERHGEALTKKEGVEILAWLHKALPTLRGEKQTRNKRSNRDEEPPF